MTTMRCLKVLAGLLAGAIGCGGAGLAQAQEGGRTFFVNAASGNDSQDGLSTQSPWRSLTKVNAAELRPGDKVLFHRGDTWRGTLIPQSGREGKPITCGAYGEGDRPLLLGSVSRSDPGDWHPESDNIWATAKPKFTKLEPLGDFAAAPWSVYVEGGAEVKTTTIPARTRNTLPSLQVRCAASGAAANHIQLSTHGVPVNDGDDFVFAFRVRSTKQFAISGIVLTKESAPWPTYGDSRSARIQVGSNWTDCEVRFKAARTAADGRITIYLGGALPAGATFSFHPVSWNRFRRNSAAELSVDVGNIIFDHGKAVGVKKWKPEDLKQQGDYWYCGDTWQVKLYSTRNPAELYKGIELALRRHIVDQGGKGHVVYENLALHNGAAHGFGGGSTHHLVIRDCDVAWIGGGHQFTTPEGAPVRFGNGIEFWADAHDNLVEGCRIWEVYDAALTNQGSGVNSQINITYRDNVIWNSEYSFEYWNRGPESTTRNIRFEHNTCSSAGHGWGHAQRPDRNGRHLMFYSNSAKTSEFHVRDNIFANATDSCLRIENDWMAGLEMDRNCWFQPSGPLTLFLRTAFAPAQFADYQKRSGMDAHSIVADPKFVNPDKLDFRLADDSPARNLADSGATAGARKRLEK